MNRLIPLNTIPEKSDRFLELIWHTVVYSGERVREDLRRFDMNGPYPTERNIRENTAVSDEQLLELSLTGDLCAFEVIVNRYKDRLFSFVMRFVNDEEMAQDIVQEAFLRAFRKRADFRAIAKFSTWIYTIAGNLAKSELRRRKRWRFLRLDSGSDDEATFELPDNANRPDRVAETTLTEPKIKAALERLPVKYREAVVLRDVEGFDYDEIADITHCPLGTVKSRINRGRLKLQDELRELAEAIF